MFLVVGLRQGALVHIPGSAEPVVNGKLSDIDATRLHSTGVPVRQHVWREPKLTPQEARELAEAHAIAEAKRRQIERDCKAGLTNVWGRRSAIKRKGLERMLKDAPRD